MTFAAGCMRRSFASDIEAIPLAFPDSMQISIRRSPEPMSEMGLYYPFAFLGIREYV